MVADNTPPIIVACDQGLVGAAYMTRRIVNVRDAYQDSRFSGNPNPNPNANPNPNPQPNSDPNPNPSLNPNPNPNSTAAGSSNSRLRRQRTAALRS